MTQFGTEKNCAVCGAEFLPTPGWVYKNERRALWFCSYGCKRKYERTPLMRPKKRNTRLNEEERKRMVSLLTKGVPLKEIATDFGVSTSTVAYWAERMA